MATHRHRKPDLVKKEEIIPDSQREDIYHHQVLANEGASSRYRYPGLVHTDTTCNKQREVVNTDNGGSAAALVEMPGHLVPLPRQNSNYSTFVGKADQVPTLGSVPERSWSVKGEDAVSVSSLGQWVKTSKLSNCLNQSSPYTQRARPGRMAVQTKPHASIKRFASILSNRPEADESSHSVIDITTKTFRKQNNASLERQSIGLLMSNKDEGQGWKQSFAGYSNPSTKSRLMKDASSRASAQSKSVIINRSPSPAFTVEQQSHLVDSKERIRNDYKRLKREGDCLRLNRQLLKKVNIKSKSTHANIQFSKSRLEQRQREDDENKKVADRTDIAVARVGRVSSVSGSQSHSMGNRIQADEWTKLRSPARVGSSISDSSVCDSKQEQSSMAGRIKQTGTERSISERRREIPAGFKKRIRFVKHLDRHEKSDNTDPVSAVHRSGFSRRDVKTETLATVYRAKYDMNGRIRNTTSGAIAAAHEQESIDRKGVSPLKLNTSANTTNEYSYNDKFKIAAKRENGLFKASMEDKKQASKVHTKIYKNTSHPPSSSQTVPETGGDKFTVLTKINWRRDKRDQEISDYSCKEDQKADRVSTSAEKHTHIPAPLSNLVNSGEFVPSVSTEQLFSTNNLKNISHAGGFRPDVTQCDILPVIYFCWQKFPDQGSEENLTKADLPQVVSLDQGLSVLRKIMTEVTSESTLYSQEFTLNQLIIKDSRSLPNCGEINNQDHLIVTGTCFQLKPRFKTKSNQIITSPASTNISSLTGLFNGDRTYFTQESEQTTFREKNSDNDSIAPILGQTQCGKNDIQTVINISKAIKNSFQRRLNVTSLWSFVSNGITDFFQYPLEIPRITFSDPAVDLGDNNGSTVDEIRPCLDAGHKLHGCTPQRRNSAVAPRQNARPVGGQGPVNLVQVTAEKSVSSCPNFKTEKLHSDRKRSYQHDTLSKSKRKFSNTIQSKSVACRKTTVGVKEVLNLSVGNSIFNSHNVCSTGHMRALADYTEISEQSLAVSEQIPVLTTTHTSSSQVVEHRLERCEKGITHGENFRIDYTSKELSRFSHSNTRMPKNTPFMKADRKEMNNVPFNTHVYESLEEPQKKADCNIVIEQRGDIANRPCENDDLAFIAPSENCPDPGIDEIENNTDSDLTARLSSSSTASLKQFPHLVWTWKYSQPTMDSQEKTDFKPDSKHLICGKDCIQEQDACTLEASVKGANCSVSTEFPCQPLCHEDTHTHEFLTDDINRIWGNAKVSRQHITSSDIPNDDKSKGSSSAKVTDICGHRQSLCNANTKELHSTCETNEAITSNNNTKDVNLPQSDCSHNLMENATQFDKNVQFKHLPSSDFDTNSGPDCSEMPHGKETYNKYSNGDRGGFYERAYTAEDSARERNHHDYMFETHSRNTKTMDASEQTVEHAVNIMTERPHSSDLASTGLESCCQQDSCEVALRVNEHHRHFLDSRVAHDTKFNTLKKMVKTLVRTKGCSFPRGKSEHNILTSVDENTASEQCIPRPTISSQSLHLFSIDNITRAAQALKEVSESHISYICNSHASACSYLIRVGCSRPFGDALSNLTSAQQRARHRERRMLDKYGSSVDDRTLNHTNENSVDNHVYGDMHTFPLYDSFENSSLGSDLLKSSLYEGKRTRKDSENSTTPNESSQLGNLHQKQPETERKLSLTKLSSNFSNVFNIKFMNQADEKTNTNERPTSSGVPTSTTQINNMRSNNFSNNFQKESNKAMAAELHLPRINDLLTPNACQSNEGQESGIFSYYSLASPTMAQTTDLDNGGSSSESFKSVFTQNLGLP